jgi:Ni,Fe-hydrogenase maturation factor
MPDLRQQLEACFQGRVCLVGVGNPDLGDDGLGVRLAEEVAVAILKKLFL